MLTTMRRYRRTLQAGLLVVVAGFVASLFVFGSKSFDGGVGGSDTTVATVNGETIPFDRYQRRYQEYLNAFAQIYRDRFTPELAEQLGLGQQVIDDLVQEALVVQRAQKEGLSVGDEELNAQIHAIPAFQERGQFSLKRYDEVLKRAGFSKGSFEDDIRRKMTRMKVEGTVRGGVKVSDGELEQAFQQKREEVRAAWALVETAPIQASVVTETAELDAYLKAHPDEFRQPERRRVQYVAVSPRDFVKPVAEAEVEKYYTEHLSEFEAPREAKAAHILARVGETGGSEAEDKAKAKIADIIRRVKAGEDFATLARQLSDDPGAKTSGGDLGWVKKGEMVPQFEQAMFAMKKGELSSEPVRTSFGFHAIRVTDVREGGRKPLKDVAPQLRERLQAEAADRAAKAKADEVKPPLQAAPDFMAEAKKLGVTPQESTLAKMTRMPGLTPRDPMEETAFTLAPGGVSAPLKTPAGWIVMKNVESLPAAVPKLAEIQDKVGAAVRRQKAESVAVTRATQIASEAKSGDFMAAAKKTGALTGETGRFSRSKPAERLPGDAMVAALRTPAGAVSEPVKTPQGVYVLKVLERVPADPKDLATERDQLSRTVLQQKQGEAWQSWMTGARQNAKIDISPRLTSKRG
jgi:peptidyl-prolyl cis-trans isomerase D